jgi:hypothetical protein
MRRLYLGVALVFTGCGPSDSKLPPLTEVEGVVLLGGQPLPNAMVKFHSTQPKLPANAIAMGVTDSAGKFRLSIGATPGAVPGDNIVTVTEGPLPEDARGPDAQDKQVAFYAKLPNRPIPDKYSKPTNSPVRVTVTTEQKEYKIELAR